MKHLRRVTPLTFCLSIMSAPFAAAQSDAVWLQEWQNYAAETGDENHVKWAEMLAHPNAKVLDAKWTALRGHSARSIIDATDLPEELKPGLVITKDNIDSFPWLDEYLPAASRDRLLSSDWFPWQSMRVVPTTPYYMSEGKLNATLKAMEEGETFSVNEQGELLNEAGEFAALAEAALPFPRPKSGLELYWMFMAHGIGNDQMAFRPIIFDVCGSDNEVERTYDGDIYWQKMHSRVDAAPFGDIEGQDGVIEAGSVVFRQPFDVAGLAVSRLRFAEANQPDDFQAYLPALRRTRQLAGSDSEDPMAAGLEPTWDDWRQAWVKPDPRKYEYEITGEKLILTQAHTGILYNPTKHDDSNCQIEQMEVELRPVWILDVTDKTGNYQYAKRRFYIDKEYYFPAYQEMYDRSGQLLRVIDDARNFQPETGLWMWINYVMWNLNTERYNRIRMHSDWDIMNEDMDGLFDIDYLRDY